MARARLTAELRSIAEDVLGTSDGNELSEESAVWVRLAASTAVAAACDVALDSLLASIDAAVADAPPSVLARLEQAAVQHDAGID